MGECRESEKESDKERPSVTLVQMTEGRPVHHTNDGYTTRMKDKPFHPASVSSLESLHRWTILYLVI